MVFGVNQTSESRSHLVYLIGIGHAPLDEFKEGGGGVADEGAEAVGQRLARGGTLLGLRRKEIGRS